MFFFTLQLGGFYLVVFSAADVEDVAEARHFPLSLRTVKTRWRSRVGRCCYCCFGECEYTLVEGARGFNRAWKDIWDRVFWNVQRPGARYVEMRGDYDSGGSPEVKGQKWREIQGRGGVKRNC